MRKIPTVLVRDPEDRAHVLNEVTSGCEWVFGDPTVQATRKYDGTCVGLNSDGSWWARREVKTGKTDPPGFRLLDVDDVTGKRMGWEPVEQSPFRQAHAEALDAEPDRDWQPGTYELLGPKVQGNPEHEPGHRLQAHADAEVMDGWPHAIPHVKAMVTAAGARGWEGIVFRRQDGLTLAKLKVRDLRDRDDRESS